MKAKTIKLILRKKIDEWLETIEDEEVKKLAAKNTIVTGGCIASMLLKEQVNDFDIYFQTYETAVRVALYYVGRFQPQEKHGIPCRIFVADDAGNEIKNADSPGRVKVLIKSAGVASEDGTTKEYEYFESRPEGAATAYVSEVMQDSGDIQDAYDETEAQALATEDEGKPKYRPVFISSNAITLSHKIQIIIRFWGKPEEIHENYDFVHCTNFWKSWDNELILNKDALECLLSKELRYVGSKYPICSLIRIRKFMQRGWTVNAGQILKAVMQISELDLKSIKVLEDQLTGVDAAYFLEVIAKLKDKDPEKVNAAYLIEIIDRMF